MPTVIKPTYDEIQAVLLNSQQEPTNEIITALFAVLEFAQKEGPGMSKIQLRRLFEEALALLPNGQFKDDENDKPDCFGLSHSPTDVLCLGGDDPTYRDEKGSHSRPQCCFFTECGSAVSGRTKSPLVPLNTLLERTAKRRRGST